jgi:hypothetical protein
MHRNEWRTPSQAQPKDCFGVENHTRFRVRARCHDGAVVWVGWFDDREDFDAFLWASISGSIRYERELWDLPTPAWRPDLGEGLLYDCAIVTTLTSPTGSNQTWTKPADWNNSDNKVETLGGGGSGGARHRGTGDGGCVSGGGGGAYNYATNISLSGNPTYRIGAGGAAVSAVSAFNNNVQGNVGGDSWFNNTALAGSSVGSKAGGAGAAATGAANGGAGGVAASGVGTGNNGGRGGNAPSPTQITSGGGAAGPTGAGNQGGDGGGNGGSGDAGAGGAVNGGNGPAWPSGGGGSGGGGIGGYNANAQTGGNYGAGGGGSYSEEGGPTAVSGAGKQGVIVIRYSPLGIFTGAKTYWTA